MNESNSSIVFCCSIFRDKIAKPGDLGMLIVPHRHSEFGPYFVLLFRAIAAADEGRLKDTGDVKVVLTVDQAIRFCPWCGTKLDDYYRACFDRLPFVDDSEV